MGTTSLVGERNTVPWKKNILVKSSVVFWSNTCTFLPKILISPLFSGHPDTDLDFSGISHLVQVCLPGGFLSHRGTPIYHHPCLRFSMKWTPFWGFPPESPNLWKAMLYIHIFVAQPDPRRFCTKISRVSPSFTMFHRCSQGTPAWAVGRPVDGAFLWGFTGGSPIAGWLIEEHRMKIDDSGVAPF